MGPSSGGPKLLPTDFKLLHQSTAFKGGTSRVVQTDYPAPDVRLTMHQNDADDIYEGLDRFGRTIDHFWDGYGTTPDVAQLKHGYDYAGNRTWREDVIAASNSQDHDEFYTYDGLHRLTNTERGNLTGSPPTAIAAASLNFEQDWTLDQLGNWDEFDEDDDGNGTWNLEQSRTHNDVNEIDTDNSHSNAPGASITATTGPNWVDPKYDAAGNMTEAPQPGNETVKHKYVYDAWNRLVKVTDSAGTSTVATYAYDGLHRRVTKGTPHAVLPDFDLTHYYYNENWQVLEERWHPAMGSEDPHPKAQYVYHPYYIDGIAVRYYDANVNNDLTENNDGTHYYVQDANFNVTAITDDTGTVLERYAYTPYGEVTVLDPDFTPDSGNQTDIGNEYLYTGRRLDPESGLQLNRHRFYHQPLGQWVSRDPIGYEGSQWNLYEYVSGQPLVAIDASGLAGSPTNCQRCLCILNHSKSECDDASDCADFARGISSFFKGGQNEAMRHCLWTCCMSQKMGQVTALRMGEIHEKCGSGTPGDTCRDRYNNEVGASIGTFRNANCVKQCNEALRRGLLQTEPGCGGFRPGSPERPHG